MFQEGQWGGERERSHWQSGVAASIDEILGAKLRNPSADFQDQALQLGVHEQCGAFPAGRSVCQWTHSRTGVVEGMWCTSEAEYFRNLIAPFNGRSHDSDDDNKSIAEVNTHVLH
jgi:hypothetical protein